MITTIYVLKERRRLIKRLIHSLFSVILIVSSISRDCFSCLRHNDTTIDCIIVDYFLSMINERVFVKFHHLFVIIFIVRCVPTKCKVIFIIFYWNIFLIMIVLKCLIFFIVTWICWLVDRAWWGQPHLVTRILNLFQDRYKDAQE